MIVRDRAVIMMLTQILALMFIIKFYKILVWRLDSTPVTDVSKKLLRVKYA